MSLVEFMELLDIKNEEQARLLAEELEYKNDSHISEEFLPMPSNY